MHCLKCHKETSLDRLQVCLSAQCQENIFCSICANQHETMHRNRMYANDLLSTIQQRLPERSVLESIQSEKVLSELERSFEKSQKLFKQLKESVIRQIDLLLGQIVALYKHLHKTYTSSHNKMLSFDHEGTLIQQIIQDNSLESLQVLLKQNSISQTSFDVCNHRSSISNNLKSKPQMSLPLNNNYNQQFRSVPRVANLFDKFEETYKEVNLFNEFAGGVLEKQLDRTAQTLYDSLEEIQRYIMNRTVLSSKKKLSSPNKFLDSLQPLFTKEEQVICHRNNMPVQSLCLNTKHNCLITASFDCCIIVRDMHNLTELFSIKAHSSWIRSVAVQEHSICNDFHYPNTILLSCGDDKQVLAWKLSNQLTENTEQSASSPVLTRLPFTISMKVSLICTLARNQMAFCLGPTDNHKILVYDIQTGICLKILQGHHKFIRCVLYLPDKNELCSGSDDGIVGIWDLREEEEGMKSRSLFKHKIQANIFPVQALLYEEQKQLLCMGCQDGKIMIYSYSGRNPKLVRVIQSSNNTQVSALCLLNWNYFTAAVGKSVLVFSFMNGALVNSVNSKSSTNISNIAYSPQLQKLYVGDVRGLLSSYSVIIM